MQMAFSSIPPKGDGRCRAHQQQLWARSALSRCHSLGGISDKFLLAHSECWRVEPNVRVWSCLLSSARLSFIC